MKKLTLYSVILLLLFPISSYGQVENPSPADYPKYELIGVEVVKPDMAPQYMEISKEIVELCKQNQFEYPFQVWSEDYFNFEVHYMTVSTLEDIEKIEEAWKEIIDQLGEEKYKRFNDCLVYTEDKVVKNLEELTYSPEVPYIESPEDIGYASVGTFYVKKGHEKDMEEILGQGKAVLDNYKKGIRNVVMKGYIGYEGPVYMIVQYGETQLDYLTTQAKVEQDMSEEDKAKFNEIFYTESFLNTINKVENRDLVFQKDLSYFDLPMLEE